MVHDANTAGIFMQPGQHGDSIYQKYEKLNKPKSAEDYLDGKFEGAAQRWSMKDIKAGPLAGKLAGICLIGA